MAESSVEPHISPGVLLRADGVNSDADDGTESANKAADCGQSIPSIPTGLRSTKGEVSGIPDVSRGSLLVGEIPPEEEEDDTVPRDMDGLEGATALDYSNLSPGQAQPDRNNCQPQDNINLEEIDVDATDIIPVSLSLGNLI